MGDGGVWLGNKDGWLPGAGHYPMEQKSVEIAKCILQFYGAAKAPEQVLTTTLIR